MLILAGCLSQATAVLPAQAHNTDQAAPPGAVVIAPRAEARIGPYELVTVFAKPTLAVFLNRFADGAPVPGAKLAASTDLQSADLTESDGGVYVTKELLLAPGGNDIEIKFTDGTVAQTATLTINMPVEAPEPAPPPLLSGRAAQIGVFGGLAGVIVLLMLGGVALLRRTRRTGIATVELSAPRG